MDSSGSKKIFSKFMLCKPIIQYWKFRFDNSTFVNNRRLKILFTTNKINMSRSVRFTNIPKLIVVKSLGEKKWNKIKWRHFTNRFFNESLSCSSSTTRNYPNSIHEKSFLSCFPLFSRMGGGEPATGISGFKHVEFSKFANATVCRSM